MRGTEEQVLKNQRRAQRLLEEIQTIKRLKPDDVTKTALREDINFESIFNKADSSVENRAVTRLATHPMIKQKISAVKDAVQKFKDNRMNQTEEPKPEQSPSTSKPAESIKREAENKPKQIKEKQKKKTEKVKLENKVMDDPVVETVDNKEADSIASNHSIEEPYSPASPQAQVLQTVPEVPSEKTVLQSSLGKATVQNKPDKKVNKPEKIIKNKPNEKINRPDKKINKPDKKIEQSIPDQKVPSTNESDSSDLEDSDEEDKEYFDDSTEERFLKQTSGFEDSDSDGEDDFFIGKVRQTKKKKSSRNDDQVKKDKLPPANANLSVRVTEEKKLDTGPKNLRMESVFCTSLSETKQKSSYMKRESKVLPFRNKKPVFPQDNTLSRRPQSVKVSAVKQQNQNKVQEQTLHPSWEASRKRKEQSQIAVFQGKKIVFDE
ncbi:serum response factor-binding protein 1 isoform X2 [Dendropsophus ebraccatus]|uniref:serum response factor-binding protein 1 isoform X2 n=1 Tax=Dendropsophus ebraccatus TaxID=150705 RepID=UPI003831306F